jgi:hypothetical protein
MNAGNRGAASDRAAGNEGVDRIGANSCLGISRTRNRAGNCTPAAGWLIAADTDHGQLRLRDTEAKRQTN